MSWVNGEDFGSVEHVNLIYDVRTLLHFHGNMRVKFRSRASNDVADYLAQRGSKNSGDICKWESS